MTPVWYQSITDVIGLHQASTQQADVCEDFRNTEKCSPSNPGHTSSSPAPAKSLQSALHNAQLVWCSPVRHGFQAAHGLISDTTWMPLLAACHSSNPPRNSSATAVRRHKKTSSLKFLGIGLSVKPEHKVRKKWHLFQMAPCTQKINTYFLLPMLVFSGSFDLYHAIQEKPVNHFHSTNWQIISCHQVSHNKTDPKVHGRLFSPGSFLKRLF